MKACIYTDVGWLMVFVFILNHIIDFECHKYECHNSMYEFHNRKSVYFFSYFNFIILKELSLECSGMKA